MKFGFKSVLVASVLLLTMVAWAAETLGMKYSAAERRHWSLRARSSPAIPTFTTPEEQRWAAQPIDAFVLQKLKSNGLVHAAPASRETLIRRVYFDLTGLAPSPAAVRQ